MVGPVRPAGLVWFSEHWLPPAKGKKNSTSEECDDRRTIGLVLLRGEERSACPGSARSCWTSSRGWWFGSWHDAAAASVPPLRYQAGVGGPPVIRPPGQRPPEAFPGQGPPPMARGLVTQVPTPSGVRPLQQFQMPPQQFAGGPLAPPPARPGMLNSLLPRLGMAPPPGAGIPGFASPHLGMPPTPAGATVMGSCPVTSIACDLTVASHVAF
ncbi:hypothetical protein Patl1_11578 [Pistacia atlantica]|uniref:Uncharacterized protein n=1 Tax=Pistacia atlantica TaxID=434234 RepID=A0ACC1A555_9ROSI|nr:hypothetical protein Patl1_11578 [Pistacia atlantica]